MNVEKLMEVGFRKETEVRKKNSVAWVRERAIPTEWPPLFGEISANFGG
jgi:hypothetical protein